VEPLEPKRFNHKVGEIDWYCELRGSGPTIVLIPSGEGDCANFETVARALADEFTVLTFDTPGFSRSSAPSDFISALLLARQIAALVTSLDLAPATFYGCSSGGIAALSLAADHPEIVRDVIVHEAALVKDTAWPEAGRARFAQLSTLDDDSIVRTCKEWFRTGMNSNPAAWDALGPDYHRRLEKNYVTWVRHYGRASDAFPSYGRDQLTRRPIAWSIGGFSEVHFAVSNLRVAQRADINVDILMCKHFPQVEIPDVLSSRIRKHAKQHLSKAEHAPQ
jgi:pimeloyl-ACP methyl ester carboxylesterase